MDIKTHCFFAARLEDLRDALHELYPQAGKNSPLKKPTVERFAKALERLRCELDSLLAVQHQDVFHPGVYYGKIGQLLNDDLSPAKTQELIERYSHDRYFQALLEACTVPRTVAHARISVPN